MDNGVDNSTMEPEVSDSQLTSEVAPSEEVSQGDTERQPPDSQSVAEQSAQTLPTAEQAADPTSSPSSTRLSPSDQIQLYVFDEETAEATSTLVDVSSLDLEIEKPEGDPKQQVHFKSERGRLLLILPADSDKNLTPLAWEELCQQLILRLSSGDRFLQPNTTVHLIARDRLLDSRQLQHIDGLLQTAQLRMKRIYTQRRQTAVAAATAGYSVEQQTKLDQLDDAQNKGKALEAPLYLQTTVRSGTEIRHAGSIVVLGDVNPGGELFAEGDIFVWGRLRGLAHAGSEGNTACRIMALHMQPTQLRIADHVARAPEKPPALYQPEVAYVGNDGIRIAIASEFAQIHLNAP